MKYILIAAISLAVTGCMSDSELYRTRPPGATEASLNRTIARCRMQSYAIGEGSGSLMMMGALQESYVSQCMTANGYE
jgi:hypothetical protein